MVTKLPPLSPVPPLSSFVTSDARQQPFASLQPGQFFKGMVAELPSAGQVVLETSMGTLTAKTDISLVKGQQVQLQVLSTTPQLELVLKQDPLQSQLRTLSAFAGRSMDLSPLVQLLQDSASSLQPSTGLSPLPVSGDSQPAVAIPANNENILALLMGKSFSAVTPQSTVNQPAAAIPVNNENIPALLMGKSSSAINPQGTLAQPLTIKASFVEQTTGDRSLLEIGGSRFAVRGEISARPGQEVLLQVRPNQAELSFALLSVAGERSAGQTVVLADKSVDLSPLLKALQLPIFRGLDLLPDFQRSTIQTLAGLDSKNLVQQESGRQVQDGVQRVGMNMEALLARGETETARASLKAALLEVVSFFKNNEELAGSAKNLLSTLELFQVAQLKLEGDVLLFPLPFSFLENGFLLVEDYLGKDGNDEQEGQHTRFSLHLTMAELGDVEVRFFRTEEGVRVRFLFDSEEKAAFVAEFREDLEEMLAPMELLSVSFSGGAVNPGNELMKRIQLGGQSLLELRV